MVTRYNAKDCSVIVDNVYITGLGEDMVTGEKDEEFFSTSVGAQGDIVRSEINNTLGTVSVTIQATSPQKKFLIGKAGSEATFPVWVVNKAMGERFGGSQALLKNYPSMERGSEVGDMQFEFAIMDYSVQAV